MALNFMPYLDDPVSKPTGHEPFTTLIKKMVSGSTLPGKMPIVDEADYDMTLGRAPVGPAASSTKIIPAAVGPSTPIAEPAFTNWNARHLPDLVSIAEDAGRRRSAEAYAKRFVGSKVGVATAPSLQFADQYYRQAQEALAKRQADLAAAGKTADQWTSDPVWSSLNEAVKGAAHMYGKGVWQAEVLGLGPALGMAGSIAQEHSPAMVPSPLARTGARGLKARLPRKERYGRWKTLLSRWRTRWRIWTERILRSPQDCRSQRMAIKRLWICYPRRMAEPMQAHSQPTL
jgi:hypothetical protein